MSDRSPDVVLIVLDDLGFADLGCYGSEIRTPHLDALAERGLRFNRFETRAICTPSRAALLSGRNPHSIGMADLPALTPEQAQGPASFRGILDESVELLPQTLKSRGYRTAAIGKWHLAPDEAIVGPSARRDWPTQRGFDTFYGFLGGHTDQFSPHLVDGDLPITPPQDPNYHLTEDLVDHAIAALAGSDAATPTFIYLATGAAHSPHQVPDSHRQRYRGAYDIGWDHVRVGRFARQKQLGLIPTDAALCERNPGDRSWDELSPDQKRVAARYQEIYAAFVEHTDEHLGRLFDHITQSGRDTIVIVLSDNGPAPEAGPEGNFRKLYTRRDTPIEEVIENLDEMGSATTRPMYPREWAMAGATPFRRYKLWPLAGGIRTPLIITWDRQISEPGAVRDQYVEIIDLAPTILDITGDPDTTEARAQDGATIRDLLNDPDAATRSTQYFELRSNRAIVDGNWKAAALHKTGTDFSDDVWQLFDLATDFSEAHDIAAERPRALAQLIELWHAEAENYIDQPLHEMSPLLEHLGYFDDGYPPRHP